MQITTGTFKQESRINGQEFQWNFQTLVETQIYVPQGNQIQKKSYIAQY